jgi:hypothetical protein
MKFDLKNRCIKSCNITPGDSATMDCLDCEMEKQKIKLTEISSASYGEGKL